MNLSFQNNPTGGAKYTPQRQVVRPTRNSPVATPGSTTIIVGGEAQEQRRDERWGGMAAVNRLKGNLKRQ